MSCVAKKQNGLFADESSTEARAVYSKAQQIVINKEFINAPVGDVIRYLQFDGSHQRMPISFPVGSTISSKATVTVNWKNISWLDALDDFCEKAGSTWELQGNGCFCIRAISGKESASKKLPVIPELNAPTNSNDRTGFFSGRIAD